MATTTNQLATRTNQFITKTKQTFQNQDASIRNLEAQVGQIANTLVERAQSALPSITETNPREHVKAITLRSGKQVETQPTTKESSLPTEKTHSDTQEEQNIQATVEPKPTTSTTSPPYVPPIPFPQRLKKKNLDRQFSKFLEVFKKLHINIPFADALEQMPSYVKFIKEILSNKEGSRNLRQCV